MEVALCHIDLPQLATVDRKMRVLRSTLMPTIKILGPAVRFVLFKGGWTICVYIRLGG